MTEGKSLYQQRVDAGWDPVLAVDPVMLDGNGNVVREDFRRPLIVPPDLVEASRRASRGDGFTSGAPWFHDEDLLLTFSPDGNAGHVVADFDLAGCRAEDIPSQDGCGLSEAKDDARFAAMCWTFVRRLIAEQDARERLL